MQSPPAPVSISAFTLFCGRSGISPAGARDLRPKSTRIVGPSRSSRAAGFSPARPVLKPACIERMRWPEYHPARQLDWACADLPDQIGTMAEALGCELGGALKIRESIYQRPIIH